MKTKGCRPLTDAEVAEVLKSFGGRYALRDRALFLLGIGTGLRISRLLALTVGDVFRDGGVVERLEVGRRRGGRGTEAVALGPPVAEALRAWIARMEREGEVGPGTVLFRSRKGENRPISRVSAYRILRTVFDENELTGKLGTHTMRRTHARVAARAAAPSRPPGASLPSLVPLLLLVLAASACARGTLSGASMAVGLDSPFALRAGQEALLEEAGLRLRFLGVPEDSRCPVDATCVWAGDARVRLLLDHPAAAAAEPLDLHTTLEPRAAAVGGYRVALEGLEPAPRGGGRVEPGEYVASLRVTRAP